MNRRSLFSGTALAAAALALSSRRAFALMAESCGADAGTQSCLELARHKALLDQLYARIAASGLPEAERKAMLAAAVCPICGQPLLPAAL